MRRVAAGVAKPYESTREQSHSLGSLWRSEIVRGAPRCAWKVSMRLKRARRWRQRGGAVAKAARGGLGTPSQKRLKRVLACAAPRRKPAAERGSAMRWVEMGPGGWSEQMWHLKYLCVEMCTTGACRKRACDESSFVTFDHTNPVQTLAFGDASHRIVVHLPQRRRRSTTMRVIGAATAAVLC